jgi:hypothetical protein
MVYKNKVNENSNKIINNEGSLKVIIFDWDDTICPSSFFDRHQIENINELPAKVSFWITMKNTTMYKI